MTDGLFSLDDVPVTVADPHYFSNGTEHRMWERYWCEGCTKDHSTHKAEPDYDNACPCIAVAMSGSWVEGWVLDNRYVQNPVMRVRCTFYAPCKCKTGGAWTQP